MSFSHLVISLHLAKTAAMNILLDAGEEEMISAASVTYFWTTDVGAGLGVDEVGFASDFILPAAVFCGGGMGSCSAVVDVVVLVDGFNAMVDVVGVDDVINKSCRS